MTAAKRIILNTAATYARTLLAMLLGLFSSRWVLNALGKDDFGLFSVVGGLMVFITMLNGLLATSVGRYYAYAIGEAKALGDGSGTEDLERWFNSAVSIHWILPVLLVMIGYPIGSYAISHWLNIPEGRESACMWVFRLSLFTSFMQMVSVPYIAMYQAKQLIAELSLWSMVVTFANFGIAYSMLSFPGDRFLAYAVLSSVAPAIVLGIQVYRARRRFGYCRVRLPYLFDGARLKKIFNFAFWDFFGWLGGNVRDQGAMFVINRSYGTGVNAAYGIAQRVMEGTGSLSYAIIGALQPAITTAVGEGKLETAKAMAFRACKFSALMVMLFAIPAIVDMDLLLKLWLVDPPAHTADLCRCILIATVVLKLGWGHHIAVCAFGRIASFQLSLGLTACCGVPLLIWFLRLHDAPIMVGYMFMAVFAVMTAIRVLFAKRLLGLSVSYWFVYVVVPIAAVCLLTSGIVVLAKGAFQPSFIRIVLLSLISSVTLFGLSWLMVFDGEEKAFVAGKLKRLRFGK